MLVNGWLSHAKQERRLDEIREHQTVRSVSLMSLLTGCANLFQEEEKRREIESEFDQGFHLLANFALLQDWTHRLTQFVELTMRAMTRLERGRSRIVSQALAKPYYRASKTGSIIRSNEDNICSG